MDDYVSRDAVLDAIYCSVTFDELLAAIDAIPAAEDAPVVRCKDCEYAARREIAGRPFVWCEHDNTLSSGDFYCGNGKAKECKGGKNECEKDT